MSKGKRSKRLKEMLFTLFLIGIALAMAYLGSAHGALVLLASLIFFEVRHPTFLEQGEELAAAQEPQPQFRQVEQLLGDIKTTLWEMKIDIGGMTTEIEEVKTEIAEVRAELAEVKSTVDDVKNELADENDF